MRRWHWLPIVLLAGYLIFAHGCHLGDHDDELRARDQLTPTAPPGR